MARIISEVRPELVYLENSPLLVGRGLALVLSDLAEMGYDAQWCLISASDTGAPHQRERIWIVAHANSWRHSPRRLPIRAPEAIAELGVGLQELADSRSEHGEGIITSSTNSQVRSRPIERSSGPRGDGFRRWPTEPGMGRVANGVANRVDRIKALGNGQVPRVAATAFYELSKYSSEVSA
ncbi:C-5 cytosine-specific DNA methylase [compost metagenome]